MKFQHVTFALFFLFFESFLFSLLQLLRDAAREKKTIFDIEKLSSFSSHIFVSDINASKKFLVNNFVNLCEITFDS